MHQTTPAQVQVQSQYQVIGNIRRSEHKKLEKFQGLRKELEKD